MNIDHRLLQQELANAVRFVQARWQPDRPAFDIVYMRASKGVWPRAHWITLEALAAYSQHHRN